MRRTSLLLLESGWKVGVGVSVQSEMVNDGEIRLNETRRRRRRRDCGGRGGRVVNVSDGSVC